MNEKLFLLAFNQIQEQIIILYTLACFLVSFNWNRITYSTLSNEVHNVIVFCCQFKILSSSHQFGFKLKSIKLILLLSERDFKLYSSHTTHWMRNCLFCHLVIEVHLSRSSIHFRFFALVFLQIFFCSFGTFIYLDIIKFLRCDMFILCNFYSLNFSNFYLTIKLHHIFF